jgi:hypothetical protein
MTTPQATTLRGEARLADGPDEPAVVTLGPDCLWLTVGSRPPVTAAYRDISHVGVDQSSIRLHLGTGPAADRWQLEHFGPQTGALVKGLRNGRLLQRLQDGLIEVAPDVEVDLVEYELPGESGTAQILYHDRGVVIAPVDDRHPWRHIRRADIGTVDQEPAVGGIQVTGTGPSLPSPGGMPALRLVRLGAATGAHAERWEALRDGAAADASAIVRSLLPDADDPTRRLVSGVMVDGRPCAPAAVGPAWEPLERAVLGREPFAPWYMALQALGGSDAARWLAAAPERPGAVTAPRAWCFVALPGNLVAMELAGDGAPATCLFRVVPRASFSGPLAAEALEAAVAEVSAAVVDARFGCEAMALPEARLTADERLPQGRAVAALPTLAAARSRFVARIDHGDEAAWAATLRELVAWHGACRDDETEWPGRADAERALTAAGADPGRRPQR